MRKTKQTEQKETGRIKVTNSHNLAASRMDKEKTHKDCC